MTRLVENDQDRVEESWRGPSGFARLARTGEFRTSDPERFQADWRAVTADGLQLGEWRSTAVSGTFHPGRSALVPQPNQPGLLRLDAVIGGRLRYRVGERLHEGGPGSVHLIHQGTPFGFEVLGPIRIARVCLYEHNAPLWLREPGVLRDGPLPPTVLTTGFVALMERLTVALRSRPEEPPLATAKAIAVLACALLEEALPSDSEQGSDLRARIVGYIDRHLGDQDLGPRSIADEFDISLRWVHRVFNTGDESIARYIRERRVDAVAAAVRTERRWMRVGDLAGRFGFAGRDQLTRAFKQRYGMTVGDYLESVLQSVPRGEPAAVRA